MKFICSTLTTHSFKRSEEMFKYNRDFLLGTVIPLLIKIKAFWCDCIIQMHLSETYIDSKVLILNTSGRDAYLCTLIFRQVRVRSRSPDFTCHMDKIFQLLGGISPSSQPVSPTLFQPTSLPTVNLPVGFTCY